MPKNEEDFIKAFYNNVVNNKPGAIHYNGQRHYVTKKDIDKYKPIFKNLEELLEKSRDEIQEQKKNGGILPLIALIPLIASIAGGLGGVTAGVATSVAKAKENQEQVRHNIEMEKIAKEKVGEGIGNNEEEDSDSEIEEIKYCINTLRGHGFTFV